MESSFFGIIIYSCLFSPLYPFFVFVCVCTFLPVHSEAVSVEQHLLSVPELSHHLAESYLTCCLYLQEMLQYKRQNHGKVHSENSGV